jgi:hypothetical protein
VAERDEEEREEERTKRKESESPRDLRAPFSTGMRMEEEWAHRRSGLGAGDRNGWNEFSNLKWVSRIVEGRKRNGGKKKRKGGKKRNSREKKGRKDRKKQSCAGEEAVVWWDLEEEKVKTEMGSRLDLLGDGRRCSTDLRWRRKSLAEFSTQSLTTTRNFPCNQSTLISPELIFI